MSHFTYTLFLAVVLSVGLALYDRKSRRDRIYRGVYVFAGFLIAIVGGGWLMHIVNP